MNHCTILRHSRTHRKIQAARPKVWHLTYTMERRFVVGSLCDVRGVLMKLETRGKIKPCGPLVSDDYARCYRAIYAAPSDTDWTEVRRLGWRVSGPFSPPSSLSDRTLVIPIGN